MPYKNEYADKTSHSNIVENQYIEEFIREIQYKVDNDDHAKKDFSSKFISIDQLLEVSQSIDTIISIDGSVYESEIDKRFPATRVSYVKIGCVLLQPEKYDNSKDRKTGFINPFKIAELQDDNSAIVFVLPSSNLTIKSSSNTQTSIRDSIRYYIEKYFLENGRFGNEDYKSSFRGTLFKLASLRPNSKNTEDEMFIKCPTCKENDIIVKNIELEQYCSKCNSKIYATDSLRLWEEVDEYLSNNHVANRLMSLVEHILPVHIIRSYIESYKNPYSLLSKTSFIIDGPLAIFGTAAWLHRSIMNYLYKINLDIKNNGLNPMIYIGLQKTGRIAEFANYFSEYIPNNSIYCIDDDYRYKYILYATSTNNGFGYETYYGQDFIYKNNKGNLFFLNLPYPFDTKSICDFNEKKINYSSYINIKNVLSLLDNFESSLYESSSIPIILAHKFTAISLKPGGQVLDVISKQISLNK